MLSLAELERAARVLDAELRGARMERVVQPDALRVVLVLHRPGGPKRHLLLCADPASARASLLERRPPAPPTPPAFASLLRARAQGARVRGVGLRGADRVLEVALEGREGPVSLLLSFLGPRTNLYLLDGEDRILGALRPPGETRRELVPGAAWQPPEGAPPRAGEDRFAHVSDEELFAAVEAHYAGVESGREEDVLRRRMERALRRARERLERKARGLEEDARGTEQAEALRREGELLKLALRDVRPRATEVRVRDPQTGGEVVLELDPAQSAAANMEERFRRARKAERRAARAVKELGVVEARREGLEALARELAAAEGAPDEGERLRALAERPEMARLLERHAPETKRRPGGAPAKAASAAPVFRVGRRELPRRLHPRRYRSRDGLEIWVGRSDEGNDILTTRLARGKDLFFHLDASPGSHVVLRTEGRDDPPPESVLEACELAVHFSRHRDAGTVDVLVAPIKSVRKPKGAKPGLVYVSGGRTVRLRRDRARLERVLASRIDDRG